MEWKRHVSIGCWTHYLTLNLAHTHELEFIFMVKFWNSLTLGIGGPMDMEWKGCESLGCQTPFVALNFEHDLDLGFLRANFNIAVSQVWGWEGHDTKAKWVNMEDGPIMWPWSLTSPVTLTLNFQSEILKWPHLRNEGLIYTEQNQCYG